MAPETYIAGYANTADEETAGLLDAIPGTVFTVGDNVYGSGHKGDFDGCYEPSWGRHKHRTNPVPGNHDYEGESEAEGYFEYFGEAAREPGKGYYSYDLGDWHVIALNSVCEKVGGCSMDSPQMKWLADDLERNHRECILAYWHHPLFSSGPHGGESQMKPAWDLLYLHGAEVVVNGHDHTYERFAPQTPEGVRNRSSGIRQFVVGTGGKSLYSFGEPKPNSEVRSSEAYGVIKFTLYGEGYDWEFVPIAGMTFKDSGSGVCR